MNKLQKKRLKKAGDEGRSSKFKTSPFKIKRPKNLQDLIDEQQQKSGGRFFSVNNDNDEDYEFAEINQNKKSSTSFKIKTKVTKTQKNKGKRRRGKSSKTVEEYLRGADSSDEQDVVNTKTTIKSNIYIEQKNTSYNLKAGRWQKK